MNTADLQEIIRILAANLWLIIPLLLWTMIWKGFALWRSAVRHDKVWFIVLLLVNTLGLLEILYLFVFSKREQVQPAEPQPETKA